MHTIKITPNLLLEYQYTSGKFIRLPNRIESKKNRFGSENRIEQNRHFFARIEMLQSLACMPGAASEARSTPGPPPRWRLFPRLILEYRLRRGPGWLSFRSFILGRRAVLSFERVGGYRPVGGETIVPPVRVSATYVLALSMVQPHTECF